MAYVQTKSEAAASMCEPITLRNQRESPLLRLPAELRNQIYTYVLGGHEICTESRPHGHQMSSHPPIQLSSRDNDGWNRPHHFLALTAASRQLRSETKWLPFKLNTFEVHHNRDFKHFLWTLTFQQRDAIRTIRLMKVNYYYSPPPTESAAAFLFQCRHLLNGLEKLINERTDESVGLHDKVPVMGCRW